LPTYEYHCDSCDRNYDVVQSFEDDPLEACPTCDSPVRKVFGTVGIVFKGSGFYKTDSRKAAAGAKAADGTATSGPGSDGAASDSAGSDSKESAGSGSPDGPKPTPAPSEKAPAPAKTPTPSASGNGKSSGSKESAKT
jgi:putative FmdB family regulatory protein